MTDQFGCWRWTPLISTVYQIDRIILLFLALLKPCTTTLVRVCIVRHEASELEVDVYVYDDVDTDYRKEDEITRNPAQH